MKEIPWQKYPWANWYAKDANGAEYLYVLEPVIAEDEGRWWPPAGMSSRIDHPRETSPFDGWRETKQRRPHGN